MENYNFNIQEELKKLPGRPGVYLMHDETDQIIYVGKAISLKNRVRQYFQSSRNKGVKIEQMVTHIRRFEYIVTDSELEALVLECNLIKEHRPKYNTMLMDDKAYPFIKVTTGEAYPRIMLARQMKKDKARYFGPYTSSQAVRDTIDLIHKLYHIRSCNRSLPKDIGKERPCLNYHIKQCEAPCQGYISQEEYRKSIDEVIRFLNGNFDMILKDLEDKMMAASEALEFEKAIEYRELLNSVKKVAQKQKITDSSGEDRDVMAVACQDEDAVVQVFFIRGGRLIGRDHFYLRISEGRTIGAVKEIASLLGLEKIVRMEAYDISNTNGFESVGSMVVYEKGKPKRNDYRKFKIKSVKGPDDYASMREVLTRRFTHGLKEREENAEAGKFTTFPDLILMDGGRGQVNIALQVLDELKLNIPVCGMVKDDNHRTRGLYYNNVEIPIDRNSEAFKLITRIQDEAHRFAIEFHRQLRGKGQVHSVLDDIEGIGPARRKALMRHYLSLDAIRSATVEELAQLPSMNEKAAESVYQFFHD